MRFAAAYAEAAIDRKARHLAASYGFLSTHPPTRCGLATFNSALAAHLTADRAASGGVVRITADIDDRTDADAGDRAGAGAGARLRMVGRTRRLGPLRPPVVHTWSARSVAGWRDAAAALNSFDVAIVQHEYGIYPGPDGADVLPLLRKLTGPSIVVLHTVLVHPTPGQAALLEQIVAAATVIVTMTDTARDRLLLGYAVDAAKVTVIPHGAAVHASTPAVPRQRPHLLTWGLLGPGKGIEWALRALARLRDLSPSPTYTVAGTTHPKVLEHHGETYRTGLHHLGTRLGISDAVHYHPAYQDEIALGAMIRSADVVVLPYDSREQVTSGVLIEAMAAGVPVVATPFPHAVELLASGTGLLVPHQDPVAMAAAIRRILTEPGLAAQLAGRTRPLAVALQWPAVAARYEQLAGRLLTTGLPAPAPV